MSQASSHSTVNLSSIVLSVRTDLILTARQYGAETMYVIEDDARSQFFRIGASEYTFLSFLDGRNTFADALGRTASVMGDDALKEDRAATFCRWLVESGLAHTLQSTSVARLTELSDRHRAVAVGQWNPMFIRFPLFCPDRLAAWGSAAFGWVFAIPAIMLWLLLVSSSLFLVLMHWSELSRLAPDVVSTDNWLWLLGTWVVLKLLHESAHAVACRRFGGSVREAGIMLLLLAPVPYVDVTSAWRFARRWPRVMTDAAGMYAELFVFAVATWLWVCCDPGFERQMLLNVMITSSVMTLAVNANPLMRFDGYFVLCDAFNLPNLAAQGRAWLAGVSRQLFFGSRAASPDWPETRIWIVAPYGVFAFLWRLSVSLGMILAADAMFYGAGVLVAAFAVAVWVVAPVVRLARMLVLSEDLTIRQRFRFVALSTSLGLAVVLVGMSPWSARRQAPVIVDYYPIVPLRTSSSGFVKQVYVRSGQTVTQGTPIALLTNPEQELQRHTLQQELKQSLARVQILRDAQELASMTSEIARAQALQKRVDELIHRGTEMTLLAPADGVIVTADLQAMLGRYLLPGSEVCRIGSGESKQVLAMVAQRDLPEFQAVAQRVVEVLIDGQIQPSLPGKLKMPEPRGRTDLLHPAFAAVNGGPPEVRVSSANADTAAEAIELTEPHFVTCVSVAEEHRHALRPGQSGQVVFRTHIGRTSDVLRESLIDWWVERQAALRRQWQ